MFQKLIIVRDESSQPCSQQERNAKAHKMTTKELTTILETYVIWICLFLQVPDKKLSPSQERGNDAWDGNKMPEMSWKELQEAQS